MSFLNHMGMGERLGALSMLLLLLAVLTGVSLTQAGLLDEGADDLENVTLPALRQVNDLRRLVDEARGLEALQLLTDSADERKRLAQQLGQQRRLVQALLDRQTRPALSAASAADEEPRLRAMVQQQLERFWNAQDKVLAALDTYTPRPGEGATDGHAAPTAAAAISGAEASARRLLAIESQAAWTAFEQALQQWTLHQEARLAARAKASRSQAEAWRMGAGGLLGAVLVLALAALAWRWRARQRAGMRRPAPSGLTETLDQIAAQSRLVALNAAVQAARSGAPSPTESAERVHLAREADALARRCDAARRKLRLGQPAVRASSFGAADSSIEPGSGFADATRVQAADSRIAEHEAGPPR